MTEDKSPTPSAHRQQTRALPSGPLHTATLARRLLCNLRPTPEHHHAHVDQTDTIITHLHSYNARLGRKPGLREHGREHGAGSQLYLVFDEIGQAWAALDRKTGTRNMHEVRWEWGEDDAVRCCTLWFPAIVFARKRVGNALFCGACGLL